MRASTAWKFGLAMTGFWIVVPILIQLVCVAIHDWRTYAVILVLSLVCYAITRARDRHAFSTPRPSVLERMPHDDRTVVVRDPQQW